MFEQLTAAQFNEWWALYNDEPFGDKRADLRAWAHVCLGWGAEKVKLIWPYIEPEMSDEEIKSEMDRIEQAIADVQRNKPTGIDQTAK